MSRLRTWLIAAGVAAVAIAIGALAWPRQQFDMVKTLAAIAEQEGPWDNPWTVQEKKIGSLQSDLRSERDPIKRLIVQRELALQYVYGGTAEPGIALLEKLLVDYGKSLPARDIETLKADLALAWFRLGEQQNCTWNRNSDGCIFPIKDDGVHKERLGAAEAAKRYTELLSDPATDPENALVYRWLLNLCYMVLGQYPDGIPKRWLIPPDRFKSDYDIGKFRRRCHARGERIRARRRRDPRGLRQRRSSRSRDFSHGHRRAAGVFPQQRRWHVHSQDGAGRAEGDRGRAQHRAGRLQQRRLHRRLRPPRCVAAR